MFRLLAQIADLSSVSTVMPHISSDATPLEEVESLLEKAVDLHENLVISGNLNTASKGGGSLLPPLVVLALVHLRKRVGTVARKDAMLETVTRQRIRTISTRTRQSTTKIWVNQFPLVGSHSS